MGFRLGSERREVRTSKNTPIFKKKLGKDINAEANMDGTIFIDSSIKKGTKKYKEAVNHELKHLEQIDEGRAAYDDYSVTWEGDKFKRQDGMIEYMGRWYPEGHKDLPWEKEAINAENKKFK